MFADTQNPLSRTLLAVGLAVVGTIGSFAVTAGPAQAATAGYSVALATPLEAPRQEIINGTMWRCAGDTCVAPADGSNPTHACLRVAREFGSVAKFAVAGRELPADKLQRCNAD